ncbi:hypothetical protein BV20DRAFT_1054381 [Pilatotrama ljubarskyi]|nr:hypothetical protein BV20DRAFT_1054381 [Pilatotrama ljubarskyi]
MSYPVSGRQREPHTPGEVKGLHGHDSDVDTTSANLEYLSASVSPGIAVQADHGLLCQSDGIVGPLADLFEQAREQDLPPARSTLPPDPSAPFFGNSQLQRRVDHGHDDVQKPPYTIANTAGRGHCQRRRPKSTDAIHTNSLIEHDTHNLYGTMMSTATHNAMLARSPGQRTLVITRSTFAGAGTRVGKWLGDNFSQWDHLQQSLSGILGMAGVYHVPMVGADICGYAENMTEALMVGAFYPFMGNHNADMSISQEFHRWPTAHVDGTPVLNPPWYKFPQDANTFRMDTQFFYSDSILVSPVLEENATSVDAYYPDKVFYDFHDLVRRYVKGGGVVHLSDVNFTSIPVAVKGGAVLPLRQKSAMTTTELRKNNFELVVAPALDGTASGSLYLDDSVSITPKTKRSMSFAFKNKKLTVKGTFGHPTGVDVAHVRFAGVNSAPHTVKVHGKAVGKAAFAYDSEKGVVDVTLKTPFNKGFSVEYQ